MTANIDAAASRRDAPIPLQAAVNEDFVAHPAALPAPKADTGLLTADPELYAAWREHVRAGFEQNSTMFRRILDAFMEPYYTTIWMYRILFGLGVVAFVAAIVVSIWLREPLFALVFGGLSIGAFLSYFVSRPIQALEENLQLITWLGVIYNSYWTHLAWATQQDTAQAELDKATTDALRQLEKLIDRHARSVRGRPKPRREETPVEQDESAGEAPADPEPSGS
jgi:hypothetical protein